MTEDVRRLIAQVEGLAEDRIVRNARIASLRATMLQCAEKLETRGNDEPRAVAEMLRREAGEGLLG